MEEEIDIIELLQRVKEGKAPKEVEIDSEFYRLVPNYATFSMEYWYEDEEDNRWIIEEYSLYTKIKILDKPIIEELEEKIHGTSLADTSYTLLLVIGKINEIIKHINKEEK